MRRKVLLVLVCMIIVAASFLGYRTIQKISRERAVTEGYRTLPPLILFDMDSTQVKMSSSGKTVLVHFNSACDICQTEIQTFVQHSAKLNKATVIFISSEAISDIRNFAIVNVNRDIPNFQFLKADAFQLSEVFGAMAVPHIFIYNGEGVLQKEYKGETKIEAIEKYL
jgi:peroxiredoxin